MQTILESKVGRGKVLLLIGPRQVGKTTLLKSMMEKLPADNYRDIVLYRKTVGFFS